MNTRAIILMALCLGTTALHGAEPTDTAAVDRHVLGTVYSLEAGGEHAFNTYPSGQWSRPFAGPRRDMDIKARANVGFLQNPARNADMNDIGISLSWQANQAFAPLPGLTLKAGAGALLDAGLLYLPRNSNNPVAART